MNWLKRLIRSVFTKLLLVIIVTGICVNIIVGTFFWIHRSAAGRPLHKNISQYLNYIIDDLGNPPRLGRAKELAKQASLQITYESSNLNWSTASDSLSNVNKAHWRDWGQNPQMRFGRYHGHHFVAIDHEDGRFVFAINRSLDLDPERGRLVFILLAVVTLILTCAFLSIRWILRPIRWLNQGVHEVSRGNLKHRVPLKRSDELRDLAEAFNDMTDRIRDMLHTKEQLMLDVSHELRSPMTRMKVALEFLPEGQAKESIRNDVLEMEAMIKAILETARMHHLHSKLKRQFINLVDLWQEILPEFDGQSPGLEREHFPDAQIVFIDPEQIKTVFKNILTNAIKYSNPDSAPIRISLKAHPPFIVVQIADSGIGIPKDELAYIFEPFYRVDKSRFKGTGGFGLGLSLCKTIMEAHGGRIEIESALEIGTIVKLFFPEKVEQRSR